MQDTAETQRVRWLTRLLVAWAAIVLLRLIHLQVFSHEELLKQARTQQNSWQEVTPQRATVFDRFGSPLAKSVEVDSVVVNPRRIPDADVAASILGRTLGLDVKDLRDRMAKAAAANRGFMWVKRKITWDESQRLRSMKFAWIEFVKESRRHYPNTRLAAHVVGSVDFRQRGNSGLELGLDNDLAGTPGKALVFTDPKGAVYASYTQAQAKQGKDVTLTIDGRIQYVAEKHLAEAAQKSGAHNGSVVVLDVKTGDILALADWPSFDPNDTPEKDTSIAARNNVGITSPYEPGSVFKVITLSAALETTQLTPETPIPCGNGVLRLGSRVIHEAKRGYGVLSMADVLAKSSNIGAIQIAMRSGQDNLYRYVREFGFGQSTGVPLPSESRGRLRPLERWGKTSLASIAMGHEISVTAIQLAQACSVIANGGRLVRPRLILKKQAPGQPAEMQPVDSGRRVISGETAIKMRRMMEGVVLHGTGKAARLKGYTSGGKTGTAQIFDFATRSYTHRYNGSFIGFAPVQNPAIVVVVTLNGTQNGTAGYGGAIAAPVFREVATAALRMLGVPKDLPDEDYMDPSGAEETDDLSIAGLDPDMDPELVSPNPPSLARGADSPSQGLFVGPQLSAAAARVVVGPRAPDFRGKTVREAIQQAAEAGVLIEFTGNGLARAQAPPPGAFVAAGERIRVQFGR